MRPKKHKTTGSNDLFRARLDQIINMKHELVLRKCHPANIRRRNSHFVLPKTGPYQTCRIRIDSKVHVRLCPITQQPGHCRQDVLLGDHLGPVIPEMHCGSLAGLPLGNHNRLTPC